MPAGPTGVHVHEVVAEGQVDVVYHGKKTIDIPHGVRHRTRLCVVQTDLLAHHTSTSKETGDLRQ